MRKSSGFTAERSGFLTAVMTRLFITAHADEGVADTNPSAPAQQPTINYEQLIAQARKEEKDKLYPQIEKLKAEKEALVNSSNAQLIKIGDLTKAYETANSELAEYKSGKKMNDEMTAIQQERDALKAEIEKLKQETPNAEQLRAEIEKEFEVKSYLKDKKRDNKDIIPSIFDSVVSGKTIEEVDASIKTAKEKSDAIKRELGLIGEDGKPVQKDAPKKGSAKQAQQQTDDKGAAPPPAANPADTSTDQGLFDVDYIQSLDPRSPEYAEFRKKLGLK